MIWRLMFAEDSELMLRRKGISSSACEIAEVDRSGRVLGVKDHVNK